MMSCATEFVRGPAGELLADSSVGYRPIDSTPTSLNAPLLDELVQMQQLNEYSVGCASDKGGQILTQSQISKSLLSTAFDCEIQHGNPGLVGRGHEEREAEMDVHLDVAFGMLRWLDRNEVTDIWNTLPLGWQERNDREFQTVPQIAGWNECPARPDPAKGHAVYTSVVPDFESLEGGSECLSRAEMSAQPVDYIEIPQLQPTPTQSPRSVCSPFSTTATAFESAVKVLKSTCQVPMAAAAKTKSNSSVSLRPLSTKTLIKQALIPAGKAEASLASTPTSNRSSTRKKRRLLQQSTPTLSEARKFLESGLSKEEDRAKKTPNQKAKVTVNYVEGTEPVASKSSRKPRKCRGSHKRLTSDVPVPFAKSDHVTRERKRRDDMASKITALDVMLPPPTFKRDRVSIVQDAILHVKSLQQAVAELQERLRTLKTDRKAKLLTDPVTPMVTEPMITDRDLPGVSFPRPGTFFDSGSNATHVKCEITETSIPQLNTSLQTISMMDDPSSSCGRNTAPVEFHVQVCNAMEAGGVKVIKRQCKANYMSCAMKILQELQLDLCRCTVTKLPHHVICILLAKVRSNASGVSASQVVARLQSDVEC